MTLQRDFRALLTDHDPSPDRLGTTDAAPGLAVYRNNYRGQLMACLEQSFPCVHSWLGDEAFALAAAAHVVRVEPGDWSLDDYPVGFAATLADLYPDDAEVSELARLESDLDIAFVAADAVPLDIATLGEIDWDHAVFRLTPSLIHREVTTNAPALWSALNAGTNPPPVERAAALSGVIVWRTAFTSCFRLADAAEHDALQVIRTRGSFAALCQRLVDALGPDEGTARSGALLGQWLRDGLIIAIETE